MAEAMNSNNCQICLDLLKDPVIIPCGHIFCMSCIKGCLGQEYDQGIYSCPQCRQKIIQRPGLNSNTFSDKTRLQACLPDHYYAGTGDVACDFCTGRKLKAVKSCLVCLVSYCETHLQPHYETPVFKKHKLVQASTQLQEKICSHHDKLLEVYCRTDQKCICLLCIMDEHKGHDTVSAAAERTDKQKQYGEEHQKSQKRIQERELEIKELRQAVDSLKHYAEAALKDTERIFTELISSIEKRHSKLKELIRAQEKAEVSQAERRLEQLEEEVAELKRRDVTLKQLSHTEDHIHFLQSFQSLCVSPGSEVLPSITVNPLISFEHVKKSVSELKNQLQDVCKKETDRIFGEVTTVHIERPAEPKTREDFLTYSVQLTLDPNTANQSLCLSEGERKVSCSYKAQSYHDHPDRFTYWNQVLCREGLSGLCYWEVEGSEESFDVAVSYKEISRKGGGFDCLFGHNDQSWVLNCSTSCFYHNNISDNIRVPCSTRVGVYLDHRAGTLSFYNVSDTMTLIHRVQTTFTQPLYPGFYVYFGKSVKILTPTL